MTRREEAGWSNPKILALFVLIFLCGAAFGSAVTRSFLHSRMTRTLVSDVSAARVSNTEQLSEMLNLTADQKRVLMQVLDDYAKYYENLEMDRENVAEHGKRQILAVLTPDQQKLFLQSFRYPVLPARSDHLPSTQNSH